MEMQRGALLNSCLRNVLKCNCEDNTKNLCLPVKNTLLCQVKSKEPLYLCSTKNLFIWKDTAEIAFILAKNNKRKSGKFVFC